MDLETKPQVDWLRCLRERSVAADTAPNSDPSALGRSAKTDAFGRRFAILPTQVQAVGLRLRQSRLACGIMLEVSRDAVAAGEEQLVSCAAEQSKY